MNDLKVGDSVRMPVGMRYHAGKLGVVEYIKPNGDVVVKIDADLSVTIPSQYANHLIAP